VTCSSCLFLTRLPTRAYSTRLRQTPLTMPTKETNLRPFTGMRSRPLPQKSRRVASGNPPPSSASRARRSLRIPRWAFRNFASPCLEFSAQARRACKQEHFAKVLGKVRRGSGYEFRRETVDSSLTKAEKFSRLTPNLVRDIRTHRRIDSPRSLCSCVDNCAPGGYPVSELLRSSTETCLGRQHIFRASG
jgi:hypothetical protein